MPWVVYILFCDQKIFYVGMTNDIRRRISEHKLKRSPYTKRFSDIKLVYKELLPSHAEAADRENQLKGWSVAKKESTYHW